MSKFMTLQGRTTTADDRGRFLWYSCNCTFWTDDTEVLKKVGPGIPVCPTCESPGFQAEAGEWMEGAMKLENTETGYLMFLAMLKGRCFGKTTMKLWKEMKELVIKLRQDGRAEVL